MRRLHFAAAATLLAVALGTSLLQSRVEALSAATPASSQCTRETGPPGLAPAAWTDSHLARNALTQPGFGEFAFITQRGERVAVKTYRPRQFDARTGRLWFVMHGTGRNADRYLQLAAPVAERHQALAIVAEFARAQYPSGDDYTLGVVERGRVDAKALIEGRWRAAERYEYNEIERVFAAVRDTLGGVQRGYYLFGHSAGAQFTHRLLTFVPCNRVEAAVAANAGWYTLPSWDERQHPIPYSLRATPNPEVSAKAVLASRLIVLLGTRDTAGSEEDPDLRSSAAAMSQGPDRLARGQHYFEVGRALASQLGVDFGWQMQLAPGARHSAAEVVASAGRLLFEPTAQSCLATPAATAASALVITEILAEPLRVATGAQNGAEERQPRQEPFVELINASAQSVCLTGWTIDGPGNRPRHLFPLGTELPPNGMLVVFGGGIPAAAAGRAEAQRATASRGLELRVRGGSVALRDAEGTLALGFSWGDCGTGPCASEHWPAPLPVGASLARAQGLNGPWESHALRAGCPASPGSTPFAESPAPCP